MQGGGGSHTFKKEGEGLRRKGQTHNGGTHQKNGRSKTQGSSQRKVQGLEGPSPGAVPRAGRSSELVLVTVNCY